MQMIVFSDEVKGDKRVLIAFVVLSLLAGESSMFVILAMRVVVSSDHDDS